MLEVEDLDDATLACHRAWNDLNTCRSIGMAVGPIPFTATLEWCRLKQLDDDNTRFVDEVIRYVDNERARDAAAKKPAGGK